jgi:hypothetical protein
VNHIGDSLLQMKALVDSADQRGVVLSLPQIVGRLFNEVTRLVHERGNRGSHRRDKDTEHQDDHDSDRRPARESTVHKLRHRGLEPEGEEHRRADQHQHGGRRAYDAHRPVRHRDAR